MSIFDNVEQVQDFGASTPRFEPGTKVRATVTELKTHESRNPRTMGHVYFIAEFDTDEGPRSLAYKLSPDSFQYGLRDAKRLVSTLLGIDSKDITTKIMDNAVSAAQTCRGVEVEVSTTSIQKKNKDGSLKPGEFFNLSTFRKVSGSIPAVAVEAAPSVPASAEFPPVGWKAHPTSAGYYYKGKEVLKEAQLRAHPDYAG